MLLRRNYIKFLNNSETSLSTSFDFFVNKKATRKTAYN